MEVATPAGPAAESCFAGEPPEVFLELPGVPVHVGVVWPSAEVARGCPRGDIRLAYGRRSGFIANLAFDPHRVDYSLRYDNALHFSPTFRAYEKDLARYLSERYDLRGKRVVEIGAGNGHFLGLLCQQGGATGTGYDPSHDAQSADPLLGTRARVHRRPYDEDGEPADLVVSRHMLEHIAEPRSFLSMLRRSLARRPDTVVYCEVPNSYLILRQISIWDVIYEHCNYFVPESLRAMFRSCGFEVLGVRSSYGDQFTSVEARLAPELAADAALECDTRELSAAVAGFPQRFAEMRNGWQSRLDALRREGRRAVLWGAGAKGVAFMNLLEAGKTIECVVDVNPGKQGSYLAGSGLAIVAPEQLRKLQPDVAIVLNPLYRDEIAAALEDLSPATQLLCM